MQRNRSIDFFKFIFSIMIIVIHADLFVNENHLLYSIITQGIVRIALPSFFIISGYFYNKKIENDQLLKQSFFKLLKLFAIFTILDLILTTKYIYPSFPNVNLFLFFWRIISAGINGTFWYIPSLIITELIITFFWKKEHYIFPIIIGFILYICLLTYDSYSFLFTESFIQKLAILNGKIYTWPQAGLFMSLFFVSIGGYINYKKNIMHIPTYYIIIGIIFLLFESYITQSFYPKDGNAYLSLIFIVPMFFMWMLEHPNMKFDTIQLGKMSLYIYFIHNMLLGFAYTFSENRYIIFVFSVLSSIIISFIIVKVTEKIKPILLYKN